MKTNPLISVIVVNYNSSKEIAELLPSLNDCGYNNFEIIIVDNASPNDSLSDLAQMYKDVRIIYSDENLGFAGANNIGLEAASGDYMLLINPDVVVTKGFIEPMLFTFGLNEKIGIISPKIKYFHTPELIQYAGYGNMSTLTMRTFSHGKGKKDGPEFSVTKKTSYAHGAAMMISRECYEKVGGMNESYFLYYEEMDWSMRIKEAGFEIYYVASSTVFHKESATVQKQSPLKIYYMSRNRMLFARLHRKSWQLIFYTLYSLFVLLPKSTLQYISKPALLKAYMSGLVWHLYTE